MEVRFEVVYEEAVKKEDIPRLTKALRERVETAIENKLMAAPEIFGVPLRYSLKGYRKLRIGDYRVVFRVEKQTVKIFAIEHRSVIYKIIASRLL